MTRPGRAGSGARRRLLVAVVGVALATAACSGGGSTTDPVGNSAENPANEKILQFIGAGGKIHISGTLAMPAGVKGPVPAVLIVPSPGQTTRDGPIIGAPIDNLYKDLSKTFTDAGVAVFRYDHRGSGASTLDPGTVPTWDDEVADAQAALKYLSERGEVDGTRLAVVGHEMSGPIALKLAAGDPAVKSVTLIAAPGRPLVDVWAGMFQTLNGQASADAFRSTVATLESTGSFPPRDSMPSEEQTLLPSGQDTLYKQLFAVDPLADAPAVKVPVLIALGEKSTSVYTDDAAKISAALGGKSEVVTAVNANVNLQTLKPPPPRGAPTDPNDMSAMGGGPLIADAPRDQPSMMRITTFTTAALAARAA